MSESTRLGISITANDAASGSIRALQTTIQSLEQQIGRITRAATEAGGAMSATAQSSIANIRTEIASIQQEISARNGQIASIKATTAAIKEETVAAEVLHRTLQQNIDHSFGVGSDRSIKSAVESANTLKFSLSAAAEADARLRDSILLTTAALRDRQAVMAATKTYREDRQMAEYINRDMDLARRHTRSQAVYENRDRDLAYDKTRREAEYENAQRTAMERARAASAPGIIAAASPERAAAGAAARVIAGGGTEAAASAAGAAAAATQLERQAVAARAVAAAEEAAARAGASQGEITAAGARAATIALREQEMAAHGAGRASRGARGGPTGTNAGMELRHAVALFDEAARNQRGAMVSTLGAAARDAGMGVGFMSAAVAGLAVVMGTVHIAEKAEELGRWATQLKASASAAGMSVQQYSALQASLGMMGLKATEADSQLRKLAVSVGTATSQPASLMAEAFHNLGISQERLVKNGGSVEGALRMVADAFRGTQDGANKSANFTEILGHNWEKLIPLLEGGSSGLENWIQKARTHGQVTKGQADQLEALGRSVREVGEVITSGAIPAFLAWKPTIEAVASSIAAMINTIMAAIKGIGQLVSAINSIPGIPDSVKGFMLGGPIGGAATAAYTSTKGLYTAARDALAANPKVGTTAQSIWQSATSNTKGESIFGRKPVGDVTPGEAAGGVAAEAAAEARRLNPPPLMPVHRGGANKQPTLDFIAQQRLLIAEADGNSAKILAIYDNMLSQLGTKYKASAAQIAMIEREKVNAVNKARLDELREGMRLEQVTSRSAKIFGEAASIAAGTMVYPGQKTIGGDQPRGQGTQALAAEAQQIEAAAQKQIAVAMQVMQSSEQGSRTQKQAAEQILAIVDSSKQQEIALYNRAAAASVQLTGKISGNFEKAIEQSGQQFQTFADSLVKALIAPQQTLIKAGLTTLKFDDKGQQMRQAAQQLMLGIVTDFTHAIGNAFSQLAASALSRLLEIPIKAGGGLSDLLASGATKGAQYVGKAVGITADAATKMPEATEFGLAGTQLQAAATSLQAAATALSGAAGGGAASGGANAVGGAASLGGSAASAVSKGAPAATSALDGAQSITGPIVAATTASSAAQVGATASSGAMQAGATGVASAANVGVTTASAAVPAAATMTAATLQTTTGTVDMGIQTTAITGAIASAAASEDALLFALNVKPSVLGFSYSSGGIVPSAAGGMVVGGTGGSLAILHAKEMVLPAPISQGMQQMISNGGPGGNGPSNTNSGNTTMNYSPTVNMAGRGRGGTGVTRGEFSQMMALHSGAMLGEARNMVKSGWRPG